MLKPTSLPRTRPCRGPRLIQRGSSTLVERLRHAQHGNASGEYGLLMCLGGPSYLLHTPALRSKRCADDLWRTTGPGRDPHPAGAPQRRLRKRLPRTLSAAALIRTGG